jgi:uroporphyrinogen decarboxylase
MLQNPDRFQVFSLGFSMFERAWSLLTMPETLIAMIASPKELDGLLENICDYNMEVIDAALAKGFDCVLIGDDWGQQKGMIMGAPHWRRFIKPHMKRMFERIKSAGKIAALHSCGDIHEVFPDLIDIGLDVYQTFQPEIYDIERVKAEFGGDLAFWGGISTQQLLPFATPERVKSEAVRIIRIMSKGGGYIAAPTHQVPGDIPPENMEALVDVFMNQDQYL